MRSDLKAEQKVKEKNSLKDIAYSSCFLLCPERTERTWKILAMIGLSSFGKKMQRRFEIHSILL